MKTKTIKQSLTFHCEPHDIYDILMNEKKHSQLTGAAAMIDKKVGGKFSAYNGYATGKNIELIKDQKIVQTWRASDWPEGVQSITTYEISKTKNGTKLTFIQTGVPEEQYESIKQGWIDFYWEPMKEMLKK